MAECPHGKRRGIVSVGLALLASCSQAPAYRPPAIAVPAAFKEAGPWVPAAPAAPVGDQWWTSFGDSQLNGLEARLLADNPDLATEYARWREARAAVGELGAGVLPAVAVGTSLTANRQSDDRPLRGANQPDLYGAHTVEGSIGYEVDLWNRVHNRIKAGRAEADATGDDAAAARLALEAELAKDYLALVGLDRESETLAKAVSAYGRADELTQNRFAGGIANGIDVGRAGATLADAQGQLADVRDQRARIEHAIASLVGANASDFSLAPTTAQLPIIAPPTLLPSQLLQRRPDIAAAERRMFAANREIGVARAAFFPSLLLGANGGFQSTALSGLLSAPNLFWSLGPSIALPLFDGGRRHAKVEEARARWDEAAGSYRSVTLNAFREVEDGLSRLHYLNQEAVSGDRGVAAATQAARLSWNRYVKGAADYLDVVTAQTAELSARRHIIQVETAQAQAGVALVRALGGGWQINSM
jgi:NodT family efflux transporter outer membrane factor (OMF) lipoprotein